MRITAGELAMDDTAHTAVDPERRLGARQAHPGTHVPHTTLREAPGPTPRRDALPASVRSKRDETANRALRRDLQVKERWMPHPETKEPGAPALIDETHRKKARDMEIGGARSRGLCGGTRAARHSDRHGGPNPEQPGRHKHTPPRNSRRSGPG